MPDGDYPLAFRSELQRAALAGTLDSALRAKLRQGPSTLSSAAQSAPLRVRVLERSLLYLLIQRLKPQFHFRVDTVFTVHQTCRPCCGSVRGVIIPWKFASTTGHQKNRPSGNSHSAWILPRQAALRVKTVFSCGFLTRTEPHRQFPSWFPGTATGSPPVSSSVPPALLWSLQFGRVI